MHASYKMRAYFSDHLMLLVTLWWPSSSVAYSLHSDMSLVIEKWSCLLIAILCNKGNFCFDFYTIEPWRAQTFLSAITWTMNNIKSGLHLWFCFWYQARIPTIILMPSRMSRSVFSLKFIFSNKKFEMVQQDKSTAVFYSKMHLCGTLEKTCREPCAALWFQEH